MENTTQNSLLSVGFVLLAIFCEFLFLGFYPKQKTPAFGGGFVLKLSLFYAAGRTKYVFVLFGIHFDKSFTGRTQIFARVKFSRFGSKYFADGGGHD